MKWWQDKIPVPRVPFGKVRVLYVWAIVFIAMCVYAVAWFTAGMIVMPFIDALTSSYDFGSQWNQVVALIKTLFLWHPIIALVGWIIWGFLNSVKRDIDRWRAY